MSQPHSTPNSCHTKCPINTLLTQGSAHSTPSQLPKCWRFPPGPPILAGLCGGPQTAHNPTETRHPSTSSPAHLSAACAHRRFLLRLPQGNSSRNTHRIYPELSQTPYSHCKSSRAFFEGGFSWRVVFFLGPGSPPQHLAARSSEGAELSASERRLICQEIILRSKKKKTNTNSKNTQKTQTQKIINSTKQRP